MTRIWSVYEADDDFRSAVDDGREEARDPSEMVDENRCKSFSPAINMWLARREEILERDDGSYDFSAQHAYDREMLYKLPLEELDSAWAELRVMILDVRKDPNNWQSESIHELSSKIEEATVPDELRVIIKKIEEEGLHRVTAPQAHFHLLANILYPVADAMAEGPEREYELGTYCAMLNGDFFEGNAVGVEDDEKEEEL